MRVKAFGDGRLASSSLPLAARGLGDGAAAIPLAGRSAAEHADGRRARRGLRLLWDGRTP